MMKCMIQSLSGYFLRNAGIDLNILLITSDYCCMKRVALFPTTMEEYHAILFTLSHLKTSTPALHT